MGTIFAPRPLLHLLALLIVLSAFSSGSQSKVCCEIKSNLNPVRAVTLPFVSVDRVSQCHWQMDEDGALRFVGPDRLVTIIHSACWKDFANGDRRLRTLYTVDVLELIDIASGKVLKQLRWDDESVERVFGTNVYLLPSASDSVILVLGRNLHLLSRDLVEQSKRALPYDHQPQESWQIASSADGRIVVAAHRVGAYGLAEIHWLSPMTLEDTNIRQSAACASQILLENDAFECIPQWASPRGSNEPAVYRFSAANAHGSVLCDRCAGVPMATSRDGLVALWHSPHYNSIMFFRGGKSELRQFGKRRDEIEGVLAATKADMMGIIYGSFPNGGFPANPKDALTLIDTKDLKIGPTIRIERIPFKEPGGDRLSGPTFALSPYADLVAIRVGWQISVFCLR